jgi:signal transduction histidine kinase/ActR/RegA family two-component response regulator
LARLASHLAADIADRLVARIKAASTSQKLAFAFALFLMPLLFLANRLANEQQAGVDSALLEQQGAAYLRVANETADLLYSQVRAGEAGEHNFDALGRGVRALESAEAIYGEGLDTAELSHRTINALQAMQANPQARGVAANAAAVGLSDLIDRIGDRSGLLRDPDRTHHFAAGVALEQAPELAATIRELAQNASRTLADGRVNEDERLLMQRLLTNLDNQTEALSEALNAVIDGNEHPEVATSLGRATSNLLANLEAYRTSLDSALSRRSHSEEILSREAGSQLVLSQLRNLVADEFDVMLAERIDQLSTERNSTLLLAGLLFLTAMASVILLLRTQIVKPIDSLAHSIRELADGGYDADIPALSRADEIGEMARAVAVLRDAAKARFAADAARAAAESASNAKTHFVASMSHELRTPLNAIIGYAEMLEEDAIERDDHAARADLSRIMNAARHLLSIINDILDMSKIEAGRMDIHAAACDPHALADDVASTARPLAAKQANKLKIDLSPVHSAYTDAQKLRQCLLNLISNACKFTKSGEVGMTMRLDEAGGEPRLVFTVTDTGIGMTPQQTDQLFKPFVQADATISREFGGTGLGLAITQRMARMLGGDVTVRSELGVGSSFRLWVPLRYRDEEEVVRQDRFARIGADHAPLIVIVDDEADVRDLVTRALTTAGFAVQGVRTADAGMQLATDAKPCLMFVDICLPGRSGWELLSNLKANDDTADIPVVVLTVDSDRRRALERGAAEHLVKPASRDLLCATALRLARARAVAAPAPPTPKLAAG